MAVYHVIINDNTRDLPESNSNIIAVMKKLVEHYPDQHYVVDDMMGRLVFVRTDEIAQEIADKLDIAGPKPSSDSDNLMSSSIGAVFKMNSSTAGYTNGAIWDWLAKNG